jgi:hypothetical protein
MGWWGDGDSEGDIALHAIVAKGRLSEFYAI